MSEPSELDDNSTRHHVGTKVNKIFDGIEIYVIMPLLRLDGKIPEGPATIRTIQPAGWQPESTLVGTGTLFSTLSKRQRLVTGTLVGTLPCSAPAPSSAPAKNDVEEWRRPSVQHQDAREGLPPSFC